MELLTFEKFKNLDHDQQQDYINIISQKVVGHNRIDIIRGVDWAPDYFTDKDNSKAKYIIDLTDYALNLNETDEALKGKLFIEISEYAIPVKTLLNLYIEKTLDKILIHTRINGTDFETIINKSKAIEHFGNYKIINFRIKAQNILEIYIKD